MRQRDAERTRREILEVATREFSEHGYSGGRVDEIAAQTRTTKRMTAEEFAAWADRPENDGKWAELVRGEVVEQPRPTRLAGPLFGSALTFAIGEKSSAPGQLDIDTVRKLWQNWAVSLE